MWADVVFYTFQTHWVYKYAHAKNQQLDLSLFICLDVSLFHPPLSSSSSEPCYLCGVFSSLFLLFAPFFCFILTLLSPFFLLLLQLFLPLSFYCVIFSLYHSVLLFSPLSFSSLTSSVSRICCSKIRQTLFLHDGSYSKLKHHYPSYCHLDVSEVLLGFRFCLKKLSVGDASTNTQWIVLILHNFRFFHLRQAW